MEHHTSKQLKRLLFELKANTLRARLAMFLIAAATVAVFSCSLARADEAQDEQRFFDGLRSRRLFSLAATHCRDQLKQQSLSDQERTNITLELSRTYVEQAHYATDEEQSDLWNQAATVVDTLLARESHSGKTMLQVQRALVSARQSEFLRSRCELFPEDGRSRSDGLRAGTDALSRLRQIEQQLATQKQRDAENRQLLNSVRLQLGTVATEISQLLPNSSPDRAEQLINADKYLTPLANRTSTDPIAWTARIGMAVVMRLRGDIGGASRAVSGLLADKPMSREIADRIAAEHVRLLLLEDRPTDAGQFCIEYRRKQKRLSGELHLLKVKALMQIRGIAAKHNSKELIPKIDAQLNSALRNVDLEVGGYWSARCRVLVNRLNESNSLGTEVAELMQQARSQFLAGQTKQSAAGYLKAAAAAAINGDAKSAADFRFTAGSILLKANEHAGAADAFGLFAKSHVRDERAAKAHLLHSWCLGQLYNTQRTSTTRQAYTQALVDHRKLFAKTDTTADATWMLGQLEEQRLQFTRALDLYRQVPSDHRYGQPARIGIARMYEKIFARLSKLKFDPAEIEKWQQKATNDLQSIAAGFPTGQLSVEQAEAITAAASVFLSFPQPDYKTADKWLQRAIAGIQSSPPEENATEYGVRTTALNNATRTRIISLAGLRQLPQAGRLLTQLANTNPASFVSVVEGLSKLSKKQTDAMAFELGLLQLKAIELLGSAPINGIDQDHMRRLKIAALMDTGDYRQAVQILQPLSDANPRDEETLKQLAFAHEGTARVQAFEKSYQLWKKIESLHKPGSKDWCAARYHVARIGLKLNKTEETAKLVKVTRLLYPQLGSPEIRGLFDELEQKIRPSKIKIP